MSDARTYDYGFKITLTLKDAAGSVVDISSATTKQMLIKDPSDTVSTKTASFTTDGTDGKIEWTSTSGFFDAYGTYEIQGRVYGASFQYTSTRAFLTTSASLT